MRVVAYQSLGALGLTLLHTSGEGNGDAQISKHDGRRYREPYRGERLLVAEQEPPLGTHIVTQRRGYTHHGIYVGDGKVVHYAGLARGLHRGPVEEVSLARFADGNPAWSVAGPPAKFDRLEVIRRARSRVGETRYRLLTNSCEHFCEWCLRDEQRSYQVEALQASAGHALHATIRFIVQLLSPPRQIGVRRRSRPQHLLA